MTTEMWRDVPDYEGIYQVSNQGRVRSLARRVWSTRGRGYWHRVPERVLKPGLVRGYERVVLQRDRRATLRRNAA